MKKLFTFLLALMASSCLWASITYELNGGKYNDYDWNNKGEMYYSVLVDINAITPTTKINFETVSLEADKTKAVNLGIPTYWSDLTVLLTHETFNEKWGWLIDYMDAACRAQSKDLASSSSAYLRYNLGAFFIESDASSYLHAQYGTLGKDAAYIPAWGQNYPNPTDPTEEVTLVNPHRVGYIFGGWYDNPECTGTPITTVNASTTGTLYAKWVLDGIVYELNGGVWNEYGWNNKSDMFNAFMKDAGVTEFETLEDYQSSPTPLASPGGICVKLTDASPALKMAKWAWLKAYIEQAHTDQTAAGASALSADGSGAAWRYAVGAFFVEIQHTGWPKSADFTELGKDAAYIPAWGQNYPSPEHPTEEVTLHTPFKEGYKFLGWYDNEACTGTPITTVNASTTGTLYAKWVLDGIVYELNGGVWNEYGWEDKGDMYKAILKDINDITPIKSGTNVNTITLEEDKTNGVKLGIPTYWNDLTVLLTHETFNTKWGWLVAYMDAICSTQSRTKPSTDQAALRYNLSAFFMDDHYASWPYSADYTTAGKVEAFQTTWGQSFPGIEHPTESTVLHIAYKQRHNFEGWYDNAECTGTAITTVDENYAGTLYAKWSLAPVHYELNGGQYNEYGWESKKDMYEDLNVDWNAFANKTNTWPAYETVYGVGNSNNGVAGKTDATFSTFFTNASYKDKWGWMVTYLDAIATKQGKTKPSTDAIPLRWGVGNFLCDDNNGSTTWHKAVDCTGEDGQLYTAQASCSFTLPNPMYPTKEVTLNNPTKEGYIFDGWYAAADFSGAAVTKVNANTKGTLYAKWKEDAYTRDLTSDNYGTICLPKGSKQTSGAIFYELACKDAQNVYLEQVNTLEAGVPYIFKPTGNLLKVVYNTTEVDRAGNHNGLYGTFVDIQDAATSDPNNVLEGNYLLVSNTIKKCGVNCKVLANRAYIILEEIPNSASAAPGRNRVSMKYEGENEATGLDNITEDSNIAPALQGTYDIMGRKLTEPSTTGFYIVNGKKVIIMK